MNGQIHLEDTPEGRLAAATYAYFLEHSKCQNCKTPVFVMGINELKEFILPYVLKELLATRVDEARKALHSTHEAQKRRVDDLNTAVAILIERGELGRERNQ